MYSKKDYEFVAGMLHRAYDTAQTNGFQSGGVPMVMYLTTEFAEAFERDREDAQARDNERAERQARNMGWKKPQYRDLGTFDRQRFIDWVRDGHNCTHHAHDKA